MPPWYTFFTTEESKLELLEDFKKVREAASDYEEALTEVRAQTDPENLDSDNTLFVDLMLAGFILPTWQAYDYFPKWRLMEMLIYLNSRADEDNATSAVERGILAAVNRVFKGTGEN